VTYHETDRDDEQTVEIPVFSMWEHYRQAMAGATPVRYPDRRSPEHDDEPTLTETRSPFAKRAA
jgi:hypothetical protein